APEILCFLGVFAITRPEVARSLWLTYRRADPKSHHAARTNLIGAFLHTALEHDQLKPLADVVVSGTRYRSLTVREPEIDGVTFSKCEIGSLRLEGGGWTGLVFEECQLGDVVV